MKNFLRPRYFFLGILIGFISCCILGYIISQQARFQRFVRFFNDIGPVLNYYTTANELLVTARHEVSHNKILVLIGGSSIFRGEGQNPDELWSEKLQKLLGEKFKVLNYASNGAGFPSFGGVAFRMLREEYPKIIFISTCSLIEENNFKIDGGELYGYLFWDAYYKKLFHSNKVEQQKITQLRKSQIKTAQGAEQHLLSFLDSLFYFRNLWNWVGYRAFFTVWNRNVNVTPFKPKRFYHEEQIDQKKLAAETALNQERFKAEVKRIAEKFPKLKDLSPVVLSYDEAFESSYRRNILAVLITYNPKHVSVLPQKDQNEYKLVLNATESLLATQGYNVMRIKSLKAEDYIDFEHFLASGGFKTAEQVAEKVKAIAKMNGYYEG